MQPFIFPLLLFFYRWLHVNAAIDSSWQCSGVVSTSTPCVEAVDRCSSSAGCFKVTWTEFKPYTYLDSKTNSFNGIIPGIFKIMMKRCCMSCWKLNLTSTLPRQSLISDNIPSYADFVFAISSNELNNQFEELNMSFVSLIKNPSVVFITKKDSVREIPKKLISAIWNSWPVLIFALLLSMISGVFLWFLELWYNPDEFPRSFIKGSWEGFWWAFVSMTTVGYGDRAPRSLLGRGFAVFWIIIGICICSIFTATLTTSLTAISLEEKKSLARAKVGAIRNSLEAHAGVTSKAKVINYNTTHALWLALDNDDVEGILLDSYFSATTEIANYIENKDFTISDTVSVDDKSFGILVRDTNLNRCLRRQIKRLHDSDVLTQIIADQIDSQHEENEAAARSNSVFDPTGDIFWPTLYTCIGFCVMIVIAGVLWDCVLNKKYFKGTAIGSMAITSPQATSLNEMENEIVKQVHSMFAVWRAQMNPDIGIAGPLKMEDVERSRGDFMMQGNGRELGRKTSKIPLQPSF